MSKQHRVFKVSANPETGQWLGVPTDTGRTTTADAWLLKRDTNALHFDTFENMESHRHGETCALEVHWIH